MPAAEAAPARRTADGTEAGEDGLCVRWFQGHRWSSQITCHVQVMMSDVKGPISGYLGAR